MNKTILKKFNVIIETTRSNKKEKYFKLCNIEVLENGQQNINGLSVEKLKEFLNLIESKQIECNETKYGKYPKYKVFVDMFFENDKREREQNEIGYSNQSINDFEVPF